MDLEQQGQIEEQIIGLWHLCIFFTEALNAVQNSIYRKALKLRAVQSLCQLDLTNASLIQDSLLNSQCQAEKPSCLPVQQLLPLLTVLFKRVRLEKPGQVEPKAPELTLNLLTAAYDRNGGGFIQPRTATAALIALSGDSLLTKYRGVSAMLHFNLPLQILAVVGESCSLSQVEAAVRSCFSGVSSKENTKLFFRTVRNNLRQGRCKRKEAQRRKALVMMMGEDFAACNQARTCSVPPTSAEQPGPPDLLPSVHTLDLKPHSPLQYGEASLARQTDGSNRPLSQEKPASQVAASFKVDIIKTQELIKALHNERSRYLRKQLNKWKEKVQLLHFTQEDRNCKLEAKIQDLIVGQENLKVELQEMRQELKKITAYRKEPLKERNVCNGSGYPPSKASTTRYTKSSGLSKVTLRSEFFKDTGPEVAHCETPRVRRVPHLGKYSGDIRPETGRDYCSQITIPSPHGSAVTEMPFDEKETEEEELQQLMMKLKDALSVLQSGQRSALKEEVLSAAEHVSKSFCALTDQVILPTGKCQDADTGLSYLPDCSKWL
ncbi:hypothetical protein lerEdw1_004413 [Lerista edwardsae]|nr:hypothetical protein lerEdw1_004413 [Lerista edwardsae]